MTAGIVGLGVIGSSLGAALRRTGTFQKVFGADIQKDTERTALNLGCIDEPADIQTIAACDRVFVVVPPHAVRDCLDSIERHRGADTYATDCASVKGPLFHWMREKPVRESWFVPGHPMAGNEGQGPEAADPELFRNATWVLCPVDSPGPCEAFEALFGLLGCRTVRMAAEDHDAIVAVTSHLPHILAGTLLQIAEGLPKPFVAGGSWKDLTRVGGANPRLWTDILTANRESVLGAIDQLVGQLTTIRASLDAGEPEAIQRFFQASRKAKENL